jgi:hypothetical protein
MESDEMAINRRLIEKYAMSALQMTEYQSAIVPQAIDLDAVGRGLGLDMADATAIARHLETAGWVYLDFSTSPRTLTISMKGLEEIERLRGSSFGLWVHRHESKITMWAAIVAILGSVASIITSIILAQK